MKNDIVALRSRKRKPQVAGPAKGIAKNNRPRPAKKSPSIPSSYPWAVDEPCDVGEHEEAEVFEPELEVTGETVVRLEVEQVQSAFSTLTKQLDWIESREKKLLLRAWPREHNADIKAGAKELQQALQKLAKLIPA